MLAVKPLVQNTSRLQAYAMPCQTCMLSLRVYITSALHVGCVCADNVAADLIMPTSDPNFPTDYGVEVKPCGYPLMNGHLD